MDKKEIAMNALKKRREGKELTDEEKKAIMEYYKSRPL
jgi:hypothetical protein